MWRAERAVQRMLRVSVEVWPMATVNPSCQLMQSWSAATQVDSAGCSRRQHPQRTGELVVRHAARLVEVNTNTRATVEWRELHSILLRV